MPALNAATLELVKQFEGFVDHWYPDPASGGKPYTCCYGHTDAAGPPFYAKTKSATFTKAEGLAASANLITSSETHMTDLAADRFRAALDKVLVHEGGKVDNPKDPGGRTNRGITQKVYNAWRQKSHLPVRDVFLILDNEVEAIYRAQYWAAVKGEELPVGVGYVVFDGAVNSGAAQSVKWLQRALGSLYTGKVDGIMGTLTLQAVGAVTDHDALIAAICARRMAFLQALKTWRTFGRGWKRRVDDVLAVGQAWASGSVGPAIEYRADGERKGDISDAKTAPPAAPGDVATGGGISGGVLGGALEQLRGQLEPYAGKFAWVGGIVVGLILVGGVLAVGGVLYRMWAAKQKAALDDALDRK